PRRAHARLGRVRPAVPGGLRLGPGPVRPLGGVPGGAVRVAADLGAELGGLLDIVGQRRQRILHRADPVAASVEPRNHLAPVRPSPHAIGFSSTFASLADHLGLTRSSAFRRTTAARLLARFPIVAEYLGDGRLCLTTSVPAGTDAAAGPPGPARWPRPGA